MTKITPNSLPPVGWTPGNKFLLGGKDLFDNYGIVVESTEGIMTMPKRKRPIKQSWPDEHGDAVDLQSFLLESRQITLNCWMVGTSFSDFVDKLNSFKYLLSVDGSLRLHIQINDEDGTPYKPLVYEVYCNEEINIKNSLVNKLNNPYGAVFSIKLIEPEPYKRVYSFSAAYGDTVGSFTISSDTPHNIFWGEFSSNGAQTVSRGVIGASQTVTYQYLQYGTYYIIVTGQSNMIITTNGTLVWERLL